MKPLAMNLFAGVLKGAVGAVARALETKGEGKPLIVYNPLSIEREDVVEANYYVLAGAPKAVRVFGPEGKEVLSQLLAASSKQVRVAFLAKVPAVGFAVYDARPAAEAAKSEELKIDKKSLENARYKVAIDENGDVSSIFDKKANKELLSAPARLAFQYNNPTQYPAWNMDWADQQKPPQGYVEGPAKVRIVENGPARVALQVTRESRGSKFVQRIRLAAGAAGDRVEFANTIDWKTSDFALKAVLPLTVSNPLATYNWEAGTLQRGNNEEKKYEVPSHQWFDLTDKDGKYGVTVLSNFKYGSDKPDDNTLRLTLLYTPGVKGGYQDQNTQDWGRHEISYALVGHPGDWRDARTDWQGIGFNQTMLAFQSAAHAGSLGKSFSLASVSDPAVIIKAIKKAENSDETIVRLIELTGKDVKGVKLALGTITAAREVDGQERPLGEAKVEDGKLVADFTPYSIHTFAVKLGEAPAKVEAPASQPVALPFDRAAATRDGQKSTGGFDKQGAALAAEMLPATLDAEGISFKLAEADAAKPNAVTCKGQVITLPEGNFNHLYLLAAAANGDTTVTFKIGNREVKQVVQDWGGYVGQWDTRTWSGTAPELTYTWTGMDMVGLKPAFLKPADVAWFSSHRHDAEGKNQLYAYSYLYKVSFELKKGEKTLTLPTAENVSVLAVTVADNKTEGARPAQPLLEKIERRNFDGKQYVWKAPPPQPRKGKKGGPKKAAPKPANALP